MNQNMRGYAAILIAVIIWGNFVLVFAYLNKAPALDIIAHRIFWGLAAFLGWMIYKGRMSEVRAVFRNKKELRLLAISALFIALNWLLFVWAAGNQHALEAGLGYFIYPLLSVAIGAIFLGDKPSSIQWLAIAIAALAVGVLTYGIGRIPTISLSIAITFGAYGLIKRYVASGAVLSVTVENILLFPFSVLWLSLFAKHELGFLASPSYAFWLAMAGFLTAVALIGFSYSSKILMAATVGMLFFINPTLQVLNGAFILGEPLLIWHKIAFPMIGLACAIYVWDLRKRPR